MSQDKVAELIKELPVLLAGGMTLYKACKSLKEKYGLEDKDLTGVMGLKNIISDVVAKSMEADRQEAKFYLTDFNLEAVREGMAKKASGGAGKR